MREGTWNQAYYIASQSFHALESEKVSLTDATFRVIACDVTALCDLPAYATSSMDGWAVRGNAPWKVIGEVVTGKESAFTLAQSQCMAIATGGVIPQGCEAVIPWENALEKQGFVTGEISVGENIRLAGQECKIGELLITQGTLLSPAMIGLLAATGHDVIEVRKKPRVAIFCLGDELLTSGVPVGGSIRDALGPQLPAFIESFGAQVISIKFLHDDLDTLITEITSLISEVDLIITTGGTADGPRDFIKPALISFNAELLIDCAKVRPGYHVLLARISNIAKEIPVIALPGNPQSALAVFTSLGRPVIDSLLGAHQVELHTVELTQSLKTPEGFSRLVPGTLEGNKFIPTGYLGSAMLRGVAFAQGFALVNPGENPAGTDARWITFPQR